MADTGSTLSPAAKADAARAAEASSALSTGPAGVFAGIRLAAAGTGVAL